ncbi:MAG: hypothetical protein F4062_04180, partial [Acidimicrobiia bacterium]|nr:hypothetical protein [Acidimicrobiia bacterium]
MPWRRWRRPAWAPLPPPSCRIWRRSSSTGTTRTDGTRTNRTGRISPEHEDHDGGSCVTTANGSLAALPWLTSGPGAGDLERDAADALARSAGALLGLQDPAGWWKGDLETNVAIEAEDLLLRTFLGICDDEVTSLTANWIRSKQCADGGWSNRYGGPSELSLAVEAYTALRLAGD